MKLSRFTQLTSNFYQLIVLNVNWIQQGRFLFLIDKENNHSLAYVIQVVICLIWHFENLSLILALLLKKEFLYVQVGYIGLEMTLSKSEFH